MQYLYHKNVRLERDWNMSNSLFRARRLWGRPLIKEMRVGKMARGWGGVGSSVYFSRPSLPTNSKPTTGSRRPAETINTKVSGKVNLIFYMINLFPIRSLVDKAQKIEKLLSQQPVSRNANSASICKFKSNPSILNRVVPHVSLHPTWQNSY